MALVAASFTPIVRADSSIEITVSIIGDGEERIGFLNYSLAGDAAKELRQKVLAEYDGAVSPFIPNGVIDSTELKYSEAAGTFISDVEIALSNIEFYDWQVASVDPMHEGYGEPITTDAMGFVGEDPATSLAPIVICLYFDVTHASAVDGDGFGDEFHDALYSQIGGSNLTYSYSFESAETGPTTVTPFPWAVAGAIAIVVAAVVIVAVYLLTRKTGK